MRALVSVLAAVLSVSGAAGEPAPGICGALVRRTASAFAVIQRNAPTDTLATVTVCLVTDTTRWRIAGYHGQVLFDPSGRVVRVDRPPGATRIENTAVHGQVSFAGVAVQGLPTGALLSFVLANPALGHDPNLHLMMLDVTDVEGRDVVTDVHVDATPRSAPPL